MEKRRRMICAIICTALAVVLCAAAFFLTAVVGFGGEYENAEGEWRRATWKSSVKWTTEHPAFDGYGKYLLPWREGTASRTVPPMSYFWMCVTTGWNTADVVDGVNFMIGREEADNVSWLEFYSSAEIAAEPDKADTGLIYIPGDKDKPFAFVVPGGGFTSEAVTAEGFTAARELHEAGYPVFILIYRVSTSRTMDEQEKLANEDFGAAAAYIFDNAGGLGVRTDGYSVWGYSAGGRLSWLWSLENDYGYAAYGIPAPAAFVFSYSGWHDERFTDSYGAVPSFFGYCADDKVLGSRLSDGIREYVAVLERSGVPVEAHEYDAPHGYGTGAGTAAEGWMTAALAFWRRYV